MNKYLSNVFVVKHFSEVIFFNVNYTFEFYFWVKVQVSRMIQGKLWYFGI